MSTNREPHEFASATPDLDEASAAWRVTRDNFMGWLFRDGGAEPPRRDYDDVQKRLAMAWVEAQAALRAQGVVQSPYPGAFEDAGYLADAASHLLDHLASEVPEFRCEDLDNVRHFATKLRALRESGAPS